MRPADWSAAGFGTDPVPGDPDGVRQGGGNYLQIADTIGDTVRGLRTLDLGGTVSEAVDALGETARTVADDIARAEQRYRATGNALVGYAAALASAQDDSLAALQRAHAAQNGAVDAQRERRRYLHLSESSDDPAEALRYERLADDAGIDSRQASAAAGVARQQILDAAARRDRAAETARDEIQNTTSEDGLNDSWWDDWGKDVLSVITDVAGTISAIAGILALVVSWIPVIGQALAAALLLVAGIAAIINAVGNIVLASTGDRTWGEAAVSIVGAALAVIGLGGAARVVGNVAMAGRINAQAAAEVAARGGTETFGALTAQQAIRLRPQQLAESERLWATTVADLAKGDDVFRLYGDGAAQTGASWSTRAPSTFGDYRSALGLPDVNSAERLVHATVDDVGAVVLQRHALPLDGMPGGAPEYIIVGGDLASKGLTNVTDIVWSVAR
ncbi:MULTISPECIES: putative T7SS-secreted protein [Microbacterium]|uniref:Putative T7SS secretion signal domain-containing protein n=1 Tax=Microbacterium hominis TaxID=162426 RepID=A0A2K9DVJ6_9MICO|nr:MULTISPECIES: hypothetical protein [Microbacterium]AUG28663.1 hypothetical protein CXR34_03745 [Microbacterium hominis]